MSKTFRGLEELSDLAIVTETDTQTVTNKTIVAASNTITTAASGNLVATELNAALAELDSDITAASITYFVEGRNTAAPNATVPVHSWTVTGAETNIDAALTPKGTGAILAQVPDGTAAGGNKRGNYAVDWQSIRASSSFVASGLQAVISGGIDNTASGESSTISGGLSNTASAIGTTVGGGDSNTASLNYSTIAGGNANTASGASSAIGGGGINTASGGSSTIGGGSNNEASGTYATIPGGQYGSTRGLIGRYSYSSGRFSITGDAQYGRHILIKTTTDATPGVLTVNQTTASNISVSTLPDAHAYKVNAYVIAREDATGDVKELELKGLVTRGAGAATVAFVGSPSSTSAFASAGAAAWTAVLVVNTTRGSVEIEVTGEAAHTIHWVGKIDTVEVG